MSNVVVVRGRVGDRVGGLSEGAALVGKALAHRCSLAVRAIGEAGPPADDDWQTSLTLADATLRDLAEAVSAGVASKVPMLVAANTCSASLATIPAALEQRPDAMVLWIDAHGDFNTPATSQSKYLGGMVVSALCGLWSSGHGAGLHPRRVALIGTRDLDRAERELLVQAGILVVPPSEATPTRIKDIVGRAPLWIHIDWDALEPGHVAADYVVPSGLLPSQLKDILGSCASSEIIGLECAEFKLPDDGRTRDSQLLIIIDIISPIIDVVRPTFLPSSAAISAVAGDRGRDGHY